MTRSWIITMAFVLAAFQLSAQETVNLSVKLRNMLNEDYSHEYGGKGQAKLYDDDFSKNPFIFKQWNYGRIDFKDGSSVDSLLLNYDDKSEDLLVKIAQEINPFAVKLNDVTTFSFYQQPSRPFIRKHRNAFDETEKDMAFYEVIYGEDDTEKTTVLKLRVKRFRDADDQVSYGSIKAEDKFDLFERYYVRTGSGKYKRFKPSKKGYQALIGSGNVKGAQALLKSNKLKWGDEAGIALVLAKYL